MLKKKIIHDTSYKTLRQTLFKGTITARFCSRRVRLGSTTNKRTVEINNQRAGESQ